MNPPRLFLLLAALVGAVGSSAIALWQARATSQAQADYAALAGRQADAEGRLRKAEARLRSAEAARAAMAEQLGAADPMAPGAVSSLATSEVGASESGRRATAETTFREVFVTEAGTASFPVDLAKLRESSEDRRARFDLKHGGFVAGLGLSATQQDRLFMLIAGPEAELNDLQEMANEPAADGPAIVTRQFEMFVEQRTALLELLGEEKFRQWQDYERFEPGRQTIEGWIGGAAQAGVSFELAQLIQLGQAFQGGRGNAMESGETDWERVAAVARSILTTKQLAYLEPHIRHQALAQKSAALLHKAEQSLDAAPPR